MDISLQTNPKKLPEIEGIVWERLKHNELSLTTTPHPEQKRLLGERVQRKKRKDKEAEKSIARINW